MLFTVNFSTEINKVLSYHVIGGNFSQLIFLDFIRNIQKNIYFSLGSWPCFIATARISPAPISIKYYRPLQSRDVICNQMLCKNLH